MNSSKNKPSNTTSHKVSIHNINTKPQRDYYGYISTDKNDPREKAKEGDKPYGEPAKGSQRY